MLFSILVGNLNGNINLHWSNLPMTLRLQMVVNNEKQMLLLWNDKACMNSHSQTQICFMLFHLGLGCLMGQGEGRIWAMFAGNQVHSTTFRFMRFGDKNTISYCHSDWFRSALSGQTKENRDFVAEFNLGNKVHKNKYIFSTLFQTLEFFFIFFFSKNSFTVLLFV